jgi:hypothetical protein
VGFSSEIERKGKKSGKNSKTFEMKKLGEKKKKKKTRLQKHKTQSQFFNKKTKG